MAHVGLSRILYEWDDLESARRHARKGIDLSELGGIVETIPVGFYILAQVHLAQAELDRALQMLGKMEQVAKRHQNRYAMARASELRMRVWMACGDGMTPSPGLKQLPLGAEPSYLAELGHLASAQALIAQTQGSAPVQRDRAFAAIEILQTVLPAAMAAGRVTNTIEGLVLQSLAFQIQGDLDRALAALDRALSLAEPQGFVRTFVDQGKPMAVLLRAVLARRIAPGYASRLLAAFGRSTPTSSTSAQILVEPLTGRELEVLRLIAAGYSNQEIADELVVAVSTVKAHINHLYGKLDVKSRTQAVARAQALDLP